MLWIELNKGKCQTIYRLLARTVHKLLTNPYSQLVEMSCVARSQHGGAMNTYTWCSV